MRLDIAALHRATPIVDGHADTFWRCLREGKDWTDPAADLRVTLPRLRETGVRVQSVTLFTEAAEHGVRATHEALRIMGHILAESRRAPGVRLLKSLADLDRTLAERDTVGLLVNMEGASPIGGDMRLYEAFHDLGVRMITLTHNHANEVADGCGVPNPGGLTPFGHRLVTRMFRDGVVVDLAHLPDPGIRDVLAMAQRPVVSSHTGLRRLCDTPRNLSDEAARGIAATGGVVAIDFYPGHLQDPATPEPCTLDRLAQVIAAALDLVGARHVALGSDWDGFDSTIPGLAHVGDLPNVTALLLDRLRLSPGETAALLGGNFLRVLRECFPNG
ncbi:MAG: dipeptidase [Planctomycetes bacterium]|nr:dipeptidase [Planctomycetota bacterium]